MLQAMMLVTTNYVSSNAFQSQKTQGKSHKLHGNQPFPCCEAFLFCNTEKTDGKIIYFKGIKQEHFIFPISTIFVT